MKQKLKTNEDIANTRKLNPICPDSEAEVLNPKPQPPCLSPASIVQTLVDTAAAARTLRHTGGCRRIDCAQVAAELECLRRGFGADPNRRPNAPTLSSLQELTPLKRMSYY